MLSNHYQLEQAPQHFELYNQRFEQEQIRTDFASKSTAISSSCADNLFMPDGGERAVSQAYNESLQMANRLHQDTHQNEANSQVELRSDLIARQPTFQESIYGKSLQFFWPIFTFQWKAQYADPGVCLDLLKSITDPETQKSLEELGSVQVQNIFIH